MSEFAEQSESRRGVRLVVQFDSPLSANDIWQVLRFLQFWSSIDPKINPPNWTHPYSRSIFVGQGFYGLKHYLNCFDLLSDYYDEATGFFATKTPLGNDLKA
jgi:hypothetical protein